MTITPLPVTPPATRGGTPRAAEGKPGKPSPADDFAAVLSGHLAGSKATGPKATAPRDEPPADTVATDSAAGVAEALLAGTVAATPVVATGAAPVGAATAPLVAATLLPAGDAVVPGLPGTATAATPATTDGAEAGEADPAAIEADAGAPALAAPEGPTGHPEGHRPVADHSVAPAIPAEASALPDVAAGAPLPAAPEHAEVPAPSPAPVGVAAPAPGTVPTTGVTPAAATPTAPAHATPVLAQVSPALARVVSRGDGEHRMMLKLHPADLGEVHLTVTVRGDHVDVEIAASPAARDVLREGSAHLRSLLESIGRSTGPLVLRDLPVAPTHAPGPGSGGIGHDGGAATSYADTGDGRRDQPDARGGRQQPRLGDQPVDRPVVTPRTSGSRSTVPGGPALDVTV